MMTYYLSRTRPLTSDAKDQVPYLSRLLGGIAGLLFLFSFASGAWAESDSQTDDGNAPRNPFQVIQDQIDLLESTPGPKGPDGPIGSKGPTGSPGPVGDRGLVGMKGPVGMQGPTGGQGPVGMKGPDGDMGPVGMKGPIGDPGPPGEPGQPGTDGNQGSTGLLVGGACPTGQVLVGFDLNGNLNCSG